MPDESPGLVSRLELYRGAYVAQDPVAIRAWERLKARAAELMAQWARERHGRDLDDLDVPARQALRSEALDLATAEL